MQLLWVIPKGLAEPVIANARKYLAVSACCGWSRPDLGCRMGSGRQAPSATAASAHVDGCGTIRNLSGVGSAVSTLLCDKRADKTTVRLDNPGRPKTALAVLIKTPQLLCVLRDSHSLQPAGENVSGSYRLTWNPSKIEAPTNSRKIELSGTRSGFSGSNHSRKASRRFAST